MYLFCVSGHLVQDGYDWVIFTFGVSSRHFHAKTNISISRALRPKGLELGTAVGFLTDVISPEYEGS